MKRIRGRITSAHAIAMLALFVALGGTGYAAIKLPKNSVGARQIKKNAVSSSKVKNGWLKKRDFAAGQLPSGPRGLQGVQGTPGADGTAAAFARIQADGSLLRALADFPATSKGIEAANVTHPSTGVYCIDLGFRPASAMVSLDNAGFNAPADGAFSVSVATERGNNIKPCTGTDARVRTTKWTDAAAPAFTDHPFVVWFEQ